MLCHVANLSSATRLTCIEAFGDSINHFNWPSDLPFLQFIHVIGKTNVMRLYNQVTLLELPVMWQNYTSLTNLNLAPVDMLDLPSWVSGLQQLTNLTVHRGTLHAFPTVIQALTRLEHLELPILTLCVLDHMAGVANLSRLTRLENGLFRDPQGGRCKHRGLEHTYDQYHSQSRLPASLLRLQAALGPSAHIQQEATWCIRLAMTRAEEDLCIIAPASDECEEEHTCSNLLVAWFMCYAFWCLCLVYLLPHTQCFLTCGNMTPLTTAVEN